ncbi:hypothetical protein HELRODRAFT_180947 [Helobdella robusta]|uniref:Uncharacterized protein n=1 Tax=Helobdella robusta TaxID=6412 RepID=T1FGG4_HELRO|nr:hypothetical protein HELRODRAFT_180947 [Helobdella robusta]ESN93416.1 hypothetical protein HELRODRAFT_180947 [Helobdella robusta]
MKQIRKLRARDGNNRTSVKNASRPAGRPDSTSIQCGEVSIGVNEAKRHCKSSMMKGLDKIVIQPFKLSLIVTACPVIVTKQRFLQESHTLTSTQQEHTNARIQRDIKFIQTEKAFELANYFRNITPRPSKQSGNKAANSNRRAHNTIPYNAIPARQYRRTEI